MCKKDETVYRVTYTDICGNTDVEGYFTDSAFNKYLEERNKQREKDGEEPEEKNEFEFEAITINY